LIMMKTAVIVGALAATAQAVDTREQLEGMFFDHMQKYDLDFEHGKEFLHRLEIFITEVKAIEAHNSDSTQTWKMGLNQFSHLTHNEWKDAVRIGSTRPPNLRRTGSQVHGEPSVDVPASVDWTTKGAVTPVKNQGQCGSCWSFSTTGSMEGAYFLKYGTLPSFSEQELVSCDGKDNGCNGGWMDDAFDWIASNGGIATESSYPYTSGTTMQTGTCQGTGNSVANSAPSSHTDVQAGSVSALQSAVAQQPVSVAIQADQMAFKSYSSGVLTGNCGTQLDHGVLAVGYGTDGSTPYWKVKNSWGETWGEEGYIRIEMDSSDKCGILLSASYPVM